MSKKNGDRGDVNIDSAPAIGANRLPARLTVSDEDGSLYDPSSSLRASAERSGI